MEQKREYLPTGETMKENFEIVRRGMKSINKVWISDTQWYYLEDLKAVEAGDMTLIKTEPKYSKQAIELAREAYEAGMKEGMIVAGRLDRNFVTADEWLKSREI